MKLLMLLREEGTTVPSVPTLGFSRSGAASGAHQLSHRSTQLQRQLELGKAEAGLQNPRTPSPPDAERGTQRSISAFAQSVCSLFLWEDKGENVKPCKTTMAAEKNVAPFKTKKSWNPRGDCSVGWWCRPNKCQVLWGWITVSLSWSDILRAAGCHGMATEGKKLLQSRKKTNLKKIFQRLANKVSLALRLGIAPKFSLSPSDKALQPGMRVRCVGGERTYLPGLENICIVMRRKCFLLWALLQETFFLAFMIVSCCLGLPRC